MNEKAWMYGPTSKVDDPKNDILGRKFDETAWMYGPISKVDDPKK